MRRHDDYPALDILGLQRYRQIQSERQGLHTHHRGLAHPFQKRTRPIPFLITVIGIITEPPAESARL